MKGILASYMSLFGLREEGGLGIGQIEIPLIQRDYAQGRRDQGVRAIRSSFLEVLLTAIAGGEPASLDFVYGKVDKGTFRPLDGQQRLTTLFLLHWYLASATGQLDGEARWTKFSYATRATARLFCEQLVGHARPRDATSPKAWITDQPWYLHVWRDDPTIEGMLVMLDTVHDLVGKRNLDLSEAWNRLTHTTSPAVAFYLLPLDDLDSDEDLYIKMNSRGKPLTPFENFKARFEQEIIYSDRAREFAHKIDGAWSDLMWPFHGGDFIADDEFMRYTEFVTEICEMHDGRMGSGRLENRARAVFGKDNVHSADHLEFLFQSFDVWKDPADIESTFNDRFTAAATGDPNYDGSKVVLFGAAATNLFEYCCHHFEGRSSGQREFTLQQSLLLYAVLLHRIHGTPDFPRRLRILRNLVAASDDEIRRLNMPELVADVARVIIDGDLDNLTKFSSNQVNDERRKRQFLVNNPDLTEALFRLEDHSILRGTLAAFDLDASTFVDRARAFESTFSDPSLALQLTGALLATGEYQQKRNWRWRFGTSSPTNQLVWRALLTNASWEELSATRRVLGELLDGVAGAKQPISDHLDGVMASWLAERESLAHFDWRYHLVKYPSMRGGATGIYVGEGDELGYSMCMLNATQLNGYYWDPFLLAVWETSGVGESANNGKFIGGAPIPRWLRLMNSATGIRSVADGYELERPKDPALAALFDGICARRDDIVVDEERILLRIPQQTVGASQVDTLDRVVIGADFMRQLVDAGL